MRVDPNDLLDPAAIAEYAVLPLSTAYQLVKSKPFPDPVIERGTTRFWARADVEAYFVKFTRPEMKRKAK